MFRFLIFLFLLSSCIIHCQSSLLTPEQFDKLDGYDFCFKQTSQYFYDMCVAIGNQFGLSEYITDNLNNLECMKFNVFLQTANNQAWKYRSTYLLSCYFEWRDDPTGNPSPKHKFLGMGAKGDDVFVYVLNSEDKMVVEGYFERLLEGISRGGDAQGTHSQ